MKAAATTLAFLVVLAAAVAALEAQTPTVTVPAWCGGSYNPKAEDPSGTNFGECAGVGEITPGRPARTREAKQFAGGSVGPVLVIEEPAVYEDKK